MVTLTAEQIANANAAKGAAGNTATNSGENRIKWLLTYAKTACSVHAERRQLRKLTDAELNDIGLSREQVIQEANRGFFDIPQR